MDSKPSKEDSKPLTVALFKNMWEKELLPSIKQEVLKELKAEFHTLKSNIIDRCNQIEKSQKFVSQKFDESTKTIQETKKQILELESKTKQQELTIQRLQASIAMQADDMDELHQYSRRDCLEIVGIPKLPDDNPKQLFKELCSAMHIELEDNEIATVHRLPDMKGQKDRIIAKLVRRDTKERIFRSKKVIIGKTTRILPSVNKELGKAVAKHSKIFINESLTTQRKKLFNAVYKFKMANKFKYIWTNNGKIYLKKDESGPVHSFSTMACFYRFENQQLPHDNKIDE